ncbi:hypothetical protein GobsT_16750 [Gemmata obscuriglobus]|nr:hypothetical protein GobsT_16750 [Gemmata obscuriglobus]VTS03071.1 unnamed protein product [Gemmata obscuriglobus UQM 2246]
MNLRGFEEPAAEWTDGRSFVPAYAGFMFTKKIFDRMNRIHRMKTN